MRRNVMFERGRTFSPDEGRDRPLRLSPRHGANVGRYAPYEPNEYSDDYFGPGDNYEARGFDDFNPPRQDERREVGGIVRHSGDPRPTARPTDSGHYGEMHQGDESWASLNRRLTRHAQTNHRGRGPKDYVRSDARLQEIICEMLTHDHDIDASEVSVHVKDGEVTLSGNVDNRRTKYLIEERIDQCGVKDIHNQIRTTRPH